MFTLQVHPPPTLHHHPTPPPSYNPPPSAATGAPPPPATSFTQLPADGSCVSSQSAGAGLWAPADPRRPPRPASSHILLPDIQLTPTAENPLDFELGEPHSPPTRRFVQHLGVAAVHASGSRAGESAHVHGQARRTNGGGYAPKLGARANYNHSVIRVIAVIWECRLAAGYWLTWTFTGQSGERCHSCARKPCTPCPKVS